MMIQFRKKPDLAANQEQNPIDLTTMVIIILPETFIMITKIITEVHMPLEIDSTKPDL